MNKVKVISGLVPSKDKCKVRRILKKDPLLFGIMWKQGITWFPLLSEEAN